jgi:hypothetical protein
LGNQKAQTLSHHLKHAAMKKITASFLLIFTLLIGSYAQTWEDRYTYNWPTACSPFVVNSSMNINIPLTISHQSLTFFLQGSPGFPSSFPLGKTYRFDVYHTDANWLTVMVGSIRKTSLDLSMPLDFQALLPAMGNGYIDIYVYVEINWPWEDTPHTINYQSYINNNPFYFKTDLEAPGNRNFEYYIGKVACFEYASCFTANLTSSVKFGKQRVFANVSGGSGNFSYQWIVEVNKFNPGGANCQRGAAVATTVINGNGISFDCDDCNKLVYCIITDNVTGCVIQYTKSLGACGGVAIGPIELEPPGPGKTKPITGNAAPGNAVNIKYLPGRNLQLTQLPLKGRTTVRIYDQTGMVVESFVTERQSQAAFAVRRVRSHTVCLVTVENNGQVLARKNILVE